MADEQIRPWHWLRRNEGVSTPKVVTVFACASSAEPLQGKVPTERQTLRAWHAKTYRPENVRPLVLAGSGEEAAGFWYHLQSVRRADASHWIFAHGLREYLTFLRFWKKLDLEEIKVHNPGDYNVRRPGRLFWMKPGWSGALVLNDPPTWIKCRWGQGVMNLVDVRNYVSAPLEDFAAAAGVELPADPDQASELPTIVGALEAEVDAVAGWLLALMKQWRDEDLGNWRPTGAGLAWNAYRHRFLDEKSVLIHANPDALKLERSAYFGARCIVGFVGEVKAPRSGTKGKTLGKTPLDGGTVVGPVTEFDVNGMYPAAMKNYDYPCRLLCVRSAVSDKQFAEWLHTHCLVSSVLINSPTRAYPIRRKRSQNAPDEVFWRTGRFWVTLTTGELLDALERGLIEAVGQTAIYERRRLFPAYVDWAFAKRNLPDEPQHKIAREFGKILTNTPYGKWGQVRQGWQDLPDEEVHGAWGTYGSKQGIFRAVGCALQKHFREGETIDSFPAIAAHVTAYARLMVDFWLEWLGPCALLYHDTDSFHVLQAGSSRITARPASVGIKLEQLKVKTQADSAEYFGQKHYRLGDVYKLGSMSIKRRLVEGGEFELDVAEPIDRLFDRDLDGSILVKRERRLIQAMPVDRQILPTGWTVPYAVKMPAAMSMRDQEAALLDWSEAHGHEQAKHASKQAPMLF